MNTLLKSYSLNKLRIRESPAVDRDQKSKKSIKNRGERSRSFTIEQQKMIPHFPNKNPAIPGIGYLNVKAPKSRATV